jgi:heat-inducible transcriptional repressor
MSKPAVLDSRKELLLKAIVREYIQSASPVASLSLGKQEGLDVSPATLRNWMAELEDLGYLKQPHPSSGRIPTNKAYRHYVDMLMEKKNLSPREKRLIARQLEAGFREIEELLEEAAQILSHIGGYAALALQPASPDLILKRLELVPIGKGKALIVLLTESGFVFDKVVELETTKERLEILSRMLNKELRGSSLLKLDPHFLENAADDLTAYLLSEITKLIAKIVEEKNSHVFIEGTHRLLDQPEFQDVGKFKNVLEAFRDETRLSRFLGRLGTQSTLRVLIGEENPLKDFGSLSVIAAPYGSRGIGFGTLAVVGPTRMDYDHLIPLVQYTASILSSRLSEILI